MTPFLWTLAAIFFAMWLAVGGLLVYTVYGVIMGRQTVSGFMKTAPRWIVAAVMLITGLTIGFIAGHWWPTIGAAR